MRVSRGVRAGSSPEPGGPGRRARKWWAVTVVAGVLAAVVSAGAAIAQDEDGPVDLVGEGIPSADVELNDDGTTATDGTRTLVVSPVDDLDPEGARVTVSGTGYDDFKGIYVAFCVVPERDVAPTPCGGGADLTGSTGASVWVSSNPPVYGESLAVAYGPDGSFETELMVEAVISEEIDCREVACAVVTRNDHQRTTDRSQDVFVPVTFAGGEDPEFPSETAIVTSSASDEDSDTTDDDGSSALPIVIGVAVVVVIAAAVAAFAISRRRRSATG